MNEVLFPAQEQTFTKYHLINFPLTITEMRIVKQYIIMIVKILEITREEFCVLYILLKKDFIVSLLKAIRVFIRNLYHYNNETVSRSVFHQIMQKLLDRFNWKFVKSWLIYQLAEYRPNAALILLTVSSWRTFV